jgi:hypothetical protein
MFGVMSVGLCSRVLLLLAASMLVPARALEPERVRPSAENLGDLRETSTELSRSLGERLDRGHDWIYRHLQNLLGGVDARFAGIERAPVTVPLSPLRLGFDSELLRRQGGWRLVGNPDFEATLRLPNIERRFRVFVSSTDLAEYPGDPALEDAPWRAGLRFAPRSHLDLDLGVRAETSPSLFAALKWTPELATGRMGIYPFAKTYVESGLGFGVSGGVAVERWAGLWVARSASFADWRHRTADTAWTHSFAFGYARAVIQERRYDRLATGHDLACGALARLAFSGDRLSQAAAYEASVLVKRPLRSGWLYGYVEPVVRWERATGWHPDAGLRFGIDALFWGLSAQSAEVASYCK